MTIRWITNLLGTAPALSIDASQDFKVIDVRDLVDKSGNSIDAVRKKLIEGVESLQSGTKTIICCDYGISRSNAIAVGVLALHESITYEAAVRRVLEATAEKEIKVEPLQVVRRALEEGSKEGLVDKNTVLITGGNGFLGKPLRQVLSSRYKVVAPTSSELNLTEGSTKLELMVSEANASTVVHLANPRVYTSNIALGATLSMLKNVIDVCVARKLRLIYMSGWEVYAGYRTPELLADESLPLLPRGPYAESKFLCEQLINHSRLAYGLNCVVLRSSPVYGVGGDKPKFIFNFIDKIKKHQKIVTHQYLNGLPSLDLLYIDDLVTAISGLVGTDYCGDLNIGTGKITSTYKIAEILQKLLNTTVETQETLIQSDVANIQMDSKKISQLLNWQPTITLEQGLIRILENQSRI